MANRKKRYEVKYEVSVMLTRTVLAFSHDDARLKVHTEKGFIRERYSGPTVDKVAVEIEDIKPIRGREPDWLVKLNEPWKS